MPLRFFFPICAFYKKIKRKEGKKNQFFTKNLKKYLYKKEYYKGKKVYITVYGKEEEQKWEVYHWRQIQVDAMDNPNREIQQQQ